MSFNILATFLRSHSLEAAIQVILIYSLLGFNNISANTECQHVEPNTIQYELTGIEDMPVKLTWNVACKNTFTGIHRVPVSIINKKTAKRVNVTLDAFCNATQKHCSAYLDKSHISPCISYILELGYHTATLNLTTYPNSVGLITATSTDSVIIPEFLNISIMLNEFDSQCALRLKSVEVLGAGRRSTEILPCQALLVGSHNSTINCVSKRFPVCLLSSSLRIRPVWYGQTKNYHNPWINSTLSWTKYFYKFNITRISSDNVTLEWLVPTHCRLLGLYRTPTVVQKSNGKIIPISSNNLQIEDNCTINCQVRWETPEKLVPCTTYTVAMGIFRKNFTTLSEISDDETDYMTIQFKAGSPDQIVLSWKHSNCQKKRIIEWEILVQEADEKSNTSIVKLPLTYENFSSPVLEYLVVVEECKTYNFTSFLRSEQTDEFYSMKIFKTPCLINRFTWAFSAIGGLLVIGFLITAFSTRFCKKRKMCTFSRRKMFSTDRSALDATTETDLDRLLEMLNRPTNIHNVWAFDAGQAGLEFSFINKLTEKGSKKISQTAAARSHQNKKKNLNKNYHPFDFNRVVLSNTDKRHGGDYINASFIPGFSGNEKEYIAAQSPTTDTIKDFWKMIWEHDAHFIVMITSLNDYYGQSICEYYWPEEGAAMYYGLVQVELLNQTEHLFYTERKISLSNRPFGDLERTITQFHFTAWPVSEKFNQFGDPHNFIRFIGIVRERTTQCFFSPIVVHCSTGVGRTGTFIALDYLIQQALVRDNIDIAKTVLRLRRFRSSMVQFETHYVFLYACISCYAESLKNEAE